MAKAKEDAEADAVEKVTKALKEADRRISEAAVGARRNEDSVTIEASRRVSAAEEASLLGSILRRYTLNQVKYIHPVIRICRVYEDRARSSNVFCALARGGGESTCLLHDVEIF